MLATFKRVTNHKHTPVFFVTFPSPKQRRGVKTSANDVVNNHNPLGGGEDNDDNDDVVGDDNPTRRMGSRWATSGRQQEAREHCAPFKATMSTDWGGLEERDGQFRVDGTTEKGRGGGDCVDAFELH